MQHRDAHGIPTIRKAIPLVLFGFGLVFTLVIAPIGVASELLQVSRGVDEAGDAMPPEWRRLFITIGVLQLLLLMLLAATACLFFRRRRVAPLMIITTIVAGMVVSVIDAAWRVSLAQGDAEYIAELVAPLVPRFFIQIAWLLYFLLSKRVKETFVYPLRDSALDVAAST